MSLATQIIDQRLSGSIAEQQDAFTHELRVGNNHGRRRSVAFLFRVARTLFDPTDEETLDSIVDGGNDFGVDVLWLSRPIKVN